MRPFFLVLAAPLTHPMEPKTSLAATQRSPPTSSRSRSHSKRRPTERQPTNRATDDTRVVQWDEEEDSISMSLLWG